MLDNLIKPGNRVDLKAIRRVKTDDEQKNRVYSTKIYDIITDDQIEIMMPMEQAKLILLPVDGEYQMFFYTDNGLYESVVRIVDRYKSNNVYIVLVELQTNLKKYQRRDFYRYSCSLDLMCRELLPEEERALEKKEVFYAPPGLPFQKGMIVDISGGGLRFITHELYNNVEYIMSRFEIFVRGSAKQYEIICRVLNARELDKRPGEFEHRVQFVNINNDEREEIIQYIFEEERKNRRKEQGLR